jgi:hypothetical protein
LSGNHGKDFGAKGVLPGAGDGAVAVGPGNQYLVISDNLLEEGKDPVSNGIAFTNVFGTGTPNSQIYVKNNRIRRFPGTGILVESNETSPFSLGTLSFSYILDNQVEDNGLDGIYIMYIPVGGIYAINVGNQLLDNQAEANQRFDCHDDSIGSSTSGTGNIWFHNTGNLSSPTGLCAPGRGNDHR